MTTPAFLDASRAKKRRAKGEKAQVAQAEMREFHNPASLNVEARNPPSGNVNKAAERMKPQGKGRAQGRGQHSAEADLSLVLAGPVASLSTRPELVAEIERIQPGAITGAVCAMVKGAQAKGPSGASDRAAMWRMLGMPWVGEGASARAAGTMLGSALGAAVAQLEQGRRHDAVTVAPVIEAKPLEMQPYEGGGHVFAQHEDGREGAEAGPVEGQEAKAQVSTPRRAR